MSREDFEGIAKLAKENHKNRVAKNPDRIQYAIEQFEKNGILIGYAILLKKK